jgi:O-antigen ligase
LIIALTTSGALLGLAMSGSRGATLTTAVSIVFLLWLTGRAEGRLFFTPRIIVFSVIVVLLGVTLFPHYRDYIPERLVTLVQSPDDALALIEDDVRRDLFEIALDIFLESPIVGAGASAAFFTVQTARGEIEISSHNMYLKLLSTSGVVGLVGYLALPMYVFVRLGSRVLLASAPQTRRVLLSPIALTWLLLIMSHGVVISIGQTTHVWLLFAATTYVCVQQTERTVARRPSRAHAWAPLNTTPHVRPRRPAVRRTFG